MKKHTMSYCGILMIVAGATFANVLAAEQPAKPADFYVAVSGKDSNPGTAAAPFATLAKARDAVRGKLKEGLAKDVLVQIRGGTYPVTETLTFGPEDSGTEKCSITYAAAPGEKVALSGGRKITGWKKGTNEIWTAEIPEAKEGKWYFRQLFVNGQRAIRARTPNADDKTPWWKITSSTIQGRVPPSNDVFSTLKVSGPIKAWKDVSDVEFVCLFNHENSRKRLSRVNEDDQTFVLHPPYATHITTPNDYQVSLPTVGKACYFENALEMLDQPGEWYLDRQTGVLSYWARTDEDMTRAEVVAPVVQKTVLAVTGTRERCVWNLHFRGIHIEHVDLPLPEGGYFGGWICFLASDAREEKDKEFVWIDAAVRFDYARACRFVDGGIAHAGGMGLTLLKGTADVVIEGNAIHDLGGGGIGAGTWWDPRTKLNPPPRSQDDYKGYRIANNHVYDCGTDYFGAFGIYIGLTREVLVAHNLVHDIAYSGIIVCGIGDGFARDNVVEYNHIYNAMEVATDGAGFYGVFPQAGLGAVIRGNLIRDVQGNPFNPRAGYCFGLYLDISAKKFHIESNVIYSQSDQAPKDGPAELLLFNSMRVEDNTFVDNVVLKRGVMPPREFIEIQEARAGLEPAYRRSLLKTETQACDFHVLVPAESAQDGWSAGQFHLPGAGRGVVHVFRADSGQETTVRLKLRGLDKTMSYEIRHFTGPLNEPYIKGKSGPPMVSRVDAVDRSAQEPQSPNNAIQFTGQELMEQGLPVKLPSSPHVTWTVYRKLKT